MPYVSATAEQLAVNIEASKAYPKAQRGVHQHPVAVVGGGPSLLARLEELRGWPGDIWAINYTADWLLDRGIECTRFSVDHDPMQSRVPKALLATSCHPTTFAGHKEVEVFDLVESNPDGIGGGTTSAGRAPALALKLGYPGIAYFGCDSSFTDIDHVDRHEGLKELIIVRVNGADYTTRPDLLLQAQELSQLIRTFDAYFTNYSDGLVRAMSEDHNDSWEIVAVSEAMKKTLIETNGDSGMYDTPYKPPCNECGHVKGHYDDCPKGMGA